MGKETHTTKLQIIIYIYIWLFQIEVEDLGTILQQFNLSTKFYKKFS